MYYCNDCQEFITPILADDGATDVCMYCGSEDIEPASQCDCGQPIRSSEDYCEDCFKLAERYILELGIESHRTTEKARDLLLAVIEKEG